MMLSMCYVPIIAWLVHLFLLSECECFTPVATQSFLPSSSSYPYYRKHLTTTVSDDDNHASKQTFVQHAVAKFRARPGTYLLIPCVAAAVGWITNWLAVQMIFYPIQFRGIPVYQKPEVPLGLLGWQGIVPCKTRPMTLVMVNMVTTQLLSVKDAFARLDPRHMARLLAPRVPQLAMDISHDILPFWFQSLPADLYQGLDDKSRSILQHYNLQFLQQLTIDIQANIDRVFDIQACVVEQMMQDRSKLGQLFRKCGQQELDFLTNSGLWFGFLLGCIQMIVALFWENPWTLSIGGALVGFATNWLALKWIFQPVDPYKLGPFTLQGMFLRRQPEVAKEFSQFFAGKILTAEKLWESVLTNATTKPAFASLFSENFQKFVNRITRGLGIDLEPETIQMVTDRAIDKLPDHVGVTYEYMDKALALQPTLQESMERMSSRQFERVLHPIFEEDELTLILAGAALGFAAGLIQQRLETGAIRLPSWKQLFRKSKRFLHAPRRETGFLGRRLSLWWQRRIVSRIASSIKFVNGAGPENKQKDPTMKTDESSSNANENPSAGKQSDVAPTDESVDEDPESLAP